MSKFQYFCVAFGQRPYCALCDSYMYPTLVPLNVPEVEEEDNDIIEEITPRRKRKADAQNSYLPLLERAEPFLPEFMVKEEPEDIPPEHEEALDFNNLPDLEVQECSMSMVDSAEAWLTENFSPSDCDLESRSSSNSDQDNTDKHSSSDESGNESDTSISSEASDSESTDAREIDSD